MEIVHVVNEVGIGRGKVANQRSEYRGGIVLPRFGTNYDFCTKMGLQIIQHRQQVPREGAVIDHGASADERVHLMAAAMNMTVPFRALVLGQRRNGAVLHVLSPPFHRQSLSVNDGTVQIEDDAVPFIPRFVRFLHRIQLRVDRVLKLGHRLREFTEWHLGATTLVMVVLSVMR